MSTPEVRIEKARSDTNRRWWTIVGLLGIAVLFNKNQTVLEYWPLLSLVGIGALYNFVVTVLIHHKKVSKFITYLEITADLSLISGLIHFTGGLFNSPFFFLYPLIVIDRAIRHQTAEIVTAGLGIAIFGFTLYFVEQPSLVQLSSLIDKLYLIVGVTAIGSILTWRYKNRTKTLQKKLSSRTLEIDSLTKSNEQMKLDIAASTNKLQDVTMSVMKKNLALMAFQEIYSAMSSTQNSRRLLNLVIDTAMSLMQGSAGCLMLFDSGSQKLKIKVARGMDSRTIRSIQPRIGEGLEGQVVRSGEESLIMNFDGSNFKPLLTPEAKSKLCVPLAIKNKIVGVLSIESIEVEAYNSSDIELLSILGAQASEVLQNIEIYQEMRNKAESLSLLFEVGKSIGTIFNLRKLFATVLERTMQVMKARRGSLLIYDKLNDELVIRASLGLSTSESEQAISATDGIAGWVYQNVKPTLIRAVEESQLYDKENDFIYAGKDLIAYPLHVRKNVFGVIVLNDRIGGKHFTKDDLDLLGALASQAAIAIENVELYASIRRDYINAVRALAAAVDAKDHYTHGHSNKVMAYSTLIAKEMGMNEKEVEKIRYGALLHDVGKIGISEALLNKPSRLTPKEFDTIAMHPILGVSIVQNIESLRELIPIILYHHERYNGGGYPEGKSGNSIPLGARIVAVADAWDVMTSDRAYRKALPISVAVSELKKCSGTQFDPEMVEVFLSALKKNEKLEPFKEDEEITADIVWDEEGISRIMDVE